ncbi:MAG: SMC-Scp complex subunit ScpB [Chloroflexi bacterium]|nr:SMC-Scp complex subunit ScpB [Chloroflexota bacterium]
MTNDGEPTREPNPAIPMKTLVESLLFAATEPVSTSQIERATGASRAEVTRAIEELELEYAERGVRIQRSDQHIQLVSAPECAEVVERFLGLQPDTRLSAAALETLAIVAYRQPVTRAAVEAIRGVNCDRALATLVSRGLIEEVGRLETVGRPAVFGTTFEFLRYFGLTSLAELPPLPDDGGTDRVTQPTTIHGS